MPSTEPRFDNSYARLPERFFVRMAATPVRAPRLLKLNVALARDLGLDPDWLESPDGMAMLAGNAVPASAESLAQAYAGHQFGGFSPQLGDGRALLIGEVIDPAGRRFDIQLKGSGPTPFSRRGDGRAALGPVLREYIVAEAMHALGVPTTRALAVVSTGERVIREEVQPGGILTRVAASHIRVGTFQYFAARGDVEAIRTLVDHVIARHYPETERADNRALALLEAVMQRQADLIAQWMNVGFIHGVMNTDNMAVSGETIDYGPCAFMDTYHPGQVYSSIDAQGRYAYGNQPAIGLWNLTRLAETLLALIDPDEKAAATKAEALLGTFPARFNEAHVAGLRRKLGLMTVARGDAELARDLLSAMADGAVDFTNTFLALADAAADEGAIHVAARAFADNRAFYAWAERWRVRLDAEVAAPDARRAMMLRANPAVIPRNHRVEEALAAAVTNGDLRLFERLVDVLSRPFALNDEDAAYAAPPQPHEVVRATFCGT